MDISKDLIRSAGISSKGLFFLRLSRLTRLEPETTDLVERLGGGQRVVEVFRELFACRIHCFLLLFKVDSCQCDK